MHLLAALVTLAISGRSNTTPAIAADHQFVAVVWGASLPDGVTDVYAAASRDGGLTFTRSVRVNDVAGDASLGAEQPPRIALVPHAGKNPEIVIVWTAKSTDGTRLLISRSRDGGATFAHATPLPASEAAGNRGWESMTVDARGRPLLLWLDHRDMAASMAGMHHEGHDHSASAASQTNGAQRAQASKLYFASLGETSSAHALTGGVCYCCKTSLATGADGSIYAAWRHVYPGNIRDIAFTVSHDGGRTFAAPVRVSSDGWMIDGCPENGPALTVDSSGAVHVVWPTLVQEKRKEPTLALFHAVTHNGRTFSPRERIDTEGTPRHPQVVPTSRGLVTAWDEEVAGGNRRVVLNRSGSRVVVSAARAQTPALADTGDGVAIAWAEGSERSVVRVELR
jgi:hypothetical protein